MRYAYLVCVDVENNHNKYYEMTENDDGSIDVEYGGIGENSHNLHYEPYEKSFDTLYKAKTRGKLERDRATGGTKRVCYEDRTAEHSISTGIKETYKPFEESTDKQSADFLNYVIDYREQFLRKQYRGLEGISQKAIDNASEQLKVLKEISENQGTNILAEFNSNLEKLFTIIPRNRNYTYLAETSSDFEKIITRENDLLETLKDKVNESKPKQSDFFEDNKLKVREITYEEEDKLFEQMGNRERFYRKAVVIEDAFEKERYNKFIADNGIEDNQIKTLYHGTRTENIYSILTQRLKLNPDAIVTGKMFGNGIYFADDMEKAMGYTSSRGSRWAHGTDNKGYVLVCDVALGKCYEPRYALGSHFNGSNLKDGCLSVYADKDKAGLRRNEYVIFSPEQYNPRYVVEVDYAHQRVSTFGFRNNKVRNQLTKGFSELEIQQDRAVTTLDLSKLDADVAKEIRGVTGCEKLRFEHFSSGTNVYKVVSDRFIPLNKDEQERDDAYFLSREMKKAFAKSDSDFEKKIEEERKAKYGSMLQDKISDCER